MVHQDDMHWSAWGMMPSRLPGTGRVADDLYLVAHHEVTGKPFLSPRAMGIALAGGLLAELMATEVPAISFGTDGLLLPRSRRPNPVTRYVRPDEPLTAQIFDLIRVESPPLPIRDWLLFLGKPSAAAVAGRLERAGYVTTPRSRMSWRSKWTVPIDSDSPRCALLRAHAALDGTKSFTQPAALLTGLTVASGLGFRFAELSKESTCDVAVVTRVLPSSLQNLIAHVQSAVDTAVLSPRM